MKSASVAFSPETNTHHITMDGEPIAELSEAAERFCRDLENGSSSSVDDREALRADLIAAGVDPWTCHFVDSNGVDVGELLI